MYTDKWKEEESQYAKIMVQKGPAATISDRGGNWPSQARPSTQQEIRAQLLYNYEDNRPVRELKLYRVLEDGLPDPIKLSRSDTHNPSITTLTKYIDFDSLFEIQKKWSMSISPTTRIEVEESNSQVTEFQLFQDGRIFRCHEENCECKN
ncbi:MAG: hypothetical protein B7Y39_18845 [Bdellovibrio sp. 28-41-41]|nr:MAG: hypothetical protein B7Y39_18845 [Bdellovibrio sp. 28-41-41]